MKKSLLIALIVILVGLFFGFDLHHILSFEGLKTRLTSFQHWQAANPVAVIIFFALLYVAVTALSLPGAVVMTLAAGALFGVLWGTVIVSFASSVGATLAFLTSRYLFRERVQQRFAHRLKTVNQGLEKDGALYLFTLRLVPVFPFFLINLLMGLTSLPVTTFYWVSQVGMLLGTVVYVNAGTQLAQLNHLSGILSPVLIASFALLGLFPFMARKAVALARGRRIYRRFTKPKHFDRNLIVIGAGAGGLVSAYIAATVKAKVTLVEAHKMGGDCLNYGCVPSKALIKSAKVANQIAHGERYGLHSTEPSFSFRRVMQRVADIITRVEPHDSIERYTDLGVEVLQGYARLLDPWTVEIKNAEGKTRRLTTRSIVLATGASPFVPPLPGIEEVGYVTSDTLWSNFAQMDEAPKRLLVLGGGPIGCELSQCFARLGSQVTLVQKGNRILPKEDMDVAEFSKKALTQDGVNILTEHVAVRCEMEGSEKYLIVENPDGELRIGFDAMLCAVGRKARLQGYGLEELGIETQQTITTNPFLQTQYPNIFAVGDVAGPYQFTHVAAHQAWYAAVNALFGGLKKFKADYRVIPHTTFIDPEIARVGLNEEEAQSQNIPYEKTLYALADLDRAITESATDGFIKVLTVPGKDRILGVTIVGERGGDLLAEFVLAMKYNLGLNKILGTIHTYPTWAEANKYAAGEWKKAHAPVALLRWVERYHTWLRG